MVLPNGGRNGLCMGPSGRERLRWMFSAHIVSSGPQFSLQHSVSLSTQEGCGVPHPCHASAVPPGSRSWASMTWLAHVSTLRTLSTLHGEA